MHSFVMLVHGRVDKSWTSEGGVRFVFTPQQQLAASRRAAKRKAAQSKVPDAGVRVEPGVDPGIGKRVGANAGAGAGVGTGDSTRVGAGVGAGVLTDVEKGVLNDVEKEPAAHTEGEGTWEDEGEDDVDLLEEEHELLDLAPGSVAGSQFDVIAEALCITPADSPVALSTVRLTCGGLRGRLCGELCFMLRKSGFPVVGDRYAKRERGSLPRSCAPLKNKLQVGCYSVLAALQPPLQRIQVETPIPDRLMATRWHAAAIAASSRNDH